MCLLLGLLLGLFPASALAQYGPPAPPSSTTSPGEDEHKPVELAAPHIEPESIVVLPRLTDTLPQPRVASHRRNELIVAGLGTLISVWAADRLIANNFIAEASGSWQPWLPIVGPWFLLSQVQQDPDSGAGTKTFLVLDGLAQASGLLVAVLGFVLRERRLVISLPAKPTAPPVSLGLSPAGPAGLSFSF